MSPGPPPLPERPEPASHRLSGLDAVRGFAILGLIFANFPAFSSAGHYRENSFALPPRSLTESLLDLVGEFFLTGKCVTLLSFLLGVGLALQRSRIEGAGKSFPAFVLRRMGGLFVIGLLHMAFLWWGDVLCFYAAMGVALLIFYRCPPFTVRMFALVGIGGTIVIFSLLSIPLAENPPLPEVTREEAGNLVGAFDSEGDFTILLARAIRLAELTYQEGSYGKILVVRLAEAALNQGLMVLLVPYYLGFVLLGYDAIRSGWFPWEGRIARPRLAVGLAVLAVALCLLQAWANAFHPSHPSATFLMIAAGLPGSIGLAAIYLVGLLRWRPGGFAHRLLSAVGRTALSNYLLQSFLAAVVFHGWGFGLYGKMSTSQGVIFLLGVVAVQLAWSACWLARFRFGPAEYLWRLLTYGKNAGPMVRPAAAQAGNS